MCWTDRLQPCSLGRLRGRAGGRAWDMGSNSPPPLTCVLPIPRTRPRAEACGKAHGTRRCPVLRPAGPSASLSRAARILRAIMELKE